MVVWSTVHRIAGKLPAGDGYGEIAESWSVPAGEAANGAVLLSHWGHRVRLEGALLGRATAEPLRTALSAHGVDVGGLVFDEGFEGYVDQVYTSGHERVVYGKFQRHGPGGGRRWRKASVAGIAGAALALIDPWFGADAERAALLCHGARTPYVTLDCRHDSVLHRYAAATVVSREYRRKAYPGESDANLRGLFARTGKGLCVFTNGSEPLHYFRNGAPCEEYRPPRVAARIAIGAGDVFRGALAHGLLVGWEDRQGVDLAARAAAAVCATIPLAAGPPNLDALLAQRSGGDDVAAVCPRPRR